MNNPSILRAHHAQVCVPKGAEDEARAFYCDVLGLTEVLKPEVMKGRGGFWLQLGDFQVHIGTEDDFGRGRSKAHVAYEVERLDGWRQKLGAAGIEIIESFEIPDYRRFEFRDPFGNRVEFLERVS